MNKHQFKKWMEEDHFACLPGLKSFFYKRTQRERDAIYRKWFKMLGPFQVGYVYEASELLMKDSEGLMPQDHPSRLVAICQRLQPSVRHPFLDEEPPSEEERRLWPALYPHVYKMLANIGEEKAAILEERSQIVSSGLLEKFDEESKVRLDELVEQLKIQALEALEVAKERKKGHRSPPAATSGPSPSTDTQNNEVPLESESEAPEPTALKETLRQALIDLDGKEDIPF